MRQAIFIILVAIFVVALCEQEQESLTCEQHQFEMAKRYDLFKGCVPINLKCMMLRSKFWFKGNFADCYDKLDGFKLDNKFTCLQSNESLGTGLECFVEMKAYVRANAVFLFITLMGCSLLAFWIVHLLMRIYQSMVGDQDAQNPNRYVVLCLNQNDVNTCVRVCATGHASR